MRERVEVKEGTTGILIYIIIFYLVGRWTERLGIPIAFDAIFFTGLFLVNIFFIWWFHK